MSHPGKSVDCEEHGSRHATYVCQHLVEGRALGFHLGVDPENPDDPWPDAWCDACEEVRRAAGQPSERSEGMADIRLLCDSCYERTRESNWLQNAAAYTRLVEQAVADLDAKQGQLQARYRIGEHERYDWHQETGQLVFSHDGQLQVVADIQFVGSISTRSHTWMWSWANQSLRESVKARLRRVRAYGEERGFLKLVAAHWSAGEEDGWEMTAVSAHLLGAMGAYRSPGDQSFTFLIMTDIRWAQ
jgi:hypothetical protein